MDPHRPLKPGVWRPVSSWSHITPHDPDPPLSSLFSPPPNLSFFSIPHSSILTQSSHIQTNISTQTNKKMPGIIPTYYLALSAGNLALLTFAWGKLAAPAAPMLRRQRGRLVSSLQRASRLTMKKGPLPQGGHAAA